MEGSFFPLTSITPSRPIALLSAHRPGRLSEGRISIVGLQLSHRRPEHAPLPDLPPRPGGENLNATELTVPEGRGTEEKKDLPEAGDAAGGNPSLKGTEGRISVSPEGRESVSLEGRISVSQTGGNPPPNKNYIRKTTEEKEGSNARGRARRRRPSFLRRAHE